MSDQQKKTADPHTDEQLHGLAKWSRFFIDKYKVSLLILFGIFIVGIFGMVANQRQDFPTIAANFINVTAVYPGASNEEIETTVIAPVEQEIGSYAEVTKMTSTIQDNFGNIFIELETFDEKAIQQLEVDFESDIRSLGLPDDVEINIVDLEVFGPTLVYTLTSETKTQKEMVDEAGQLVEYLDSTSDEIRKVELYPAVEFEVEVSLDNGKLLEQGLSAGDVSESIQAYVTTLPGGEIKTKDLKTKQIQLISPADSLDELNELQIAPGVKLADVAEIDRELTQADLVNIVGFTQDGVPGYGEDVVYVLVYKTDNGDVIRIDEAVKEAAEEIYEKEILPNDISFIEVSSNAVYVEDQINSLAENGMIGLGLILLVFLFFINLRTGIVVSLIIPIAFLITFGVLNLIGFTINVLTLFAMILTLGILVDNAIVIAEGVMHRMTKYGEDKKTAAIGAVQDLGPAVTVATITTVVAFVPFATMGGIMGEILKYIPYTVIIMLVSSYFLAVTFTPLFANAILKQAKPGDDEDGQKMKRWQKALIIPLIVRAGQKGVDNMQMLYASFMSKVLQSWTWKFGLLGLAGVLLAGSLFLPASGLMKSAQFPDTGDGMAISVGVEFEPGTDNSVKKELFAEVAEQAITLDHFTAAYFFDEVFYVQLVEPAQRTEKKDVTAYDVMDDLEAKLGDIESRYDEVRDVRLQVSGEGPPSDDYDLNINFKSRDSERLAAIIEDVDGFIHQQVEEDDQLKIDRIVNDMEDSLVPFVDIEFDEAAMVERGVSPLMASLSVNSIFSETSAGKITLTGQAQADEIKVRFDRESTDSLEDIRNVLVPSQTGVVRLSEIAVITEVNKSIRLTRVDGERAVSYKVRLEADEDDRGNLAASLEREVQKYLDDDKLAEYGLEKEDVAYGGFAADLASDFEQLGIVMMLALIAVYLILVYQFNSFGQPMVIMAAIPLAMIGVFPGIFLVDSSLDLISGLGVVALIGIVVNDAIVFLDYFNRQAKRHPDWTLAKTLLYTGKVRFRPIFSTSITTIGGILPLTIQDPFWRGLGAALSLGLVFSTLGTLIILPVIMEIVVGLTRSKFFQRLMKMRFFWAMRYVFFLPLDWAFENSYKKESDKPAQLAIAGRVGIDQSDFKGDKM